MAAEIDRVFHIYHSGYAQSYRWVVMPDPDAPEHGVCIEYEQCEDKHWECFGGMRLTVRDDIAQAIAKCILEIVESRKNG